MWFAIQGEQVAGIGIRGVEVCIGVYPDIGHLIDGIEAVRGTAEHAVVNEMGITDECAVVLVAGDVLGVIIKRPVAFQGCDGIGHAGVTK